jgi:hypothetical protein
MKLDIVRCPVRSTSLKGAENEELSRILALFVEMTARRKNKEYKSVLVFIIIETMRSTSHLQKEREIEYDQLLASKIATMTLLSYEIERDRI